jgi:hypothetical protein
MVSGVVEFLIYHLRCHIKSQAPTINLELFQCYLLRLDPNHIYGVGVVPTLGGVTTGAGVVAAGTATVVTAAAKKNI